MKEVYYHRIYENLEQYFRGRKVLVIYGPRRVGKTTILKRFLEKVEKNAGLKRYKKFLPFKYVTGDDINVVNSLSVPILDKLIEFCEGARLLVIDEAQRIPDIGRSVKLLIDSTEDIYVILTGSSTFNLRGEIGEPLTGRKFDLILYPLSIFELRKQFGDYWIKTHLEDFLIFGMYPEVLAASSSKNKRLILEELVGSYLLKDILEFEKIRYSRVIIQLLRLLAFQIGSEVSFNELASSLGIDVKTVIRYLDLLEQVFVIFRLPSFSRNLSNEITKKHKYYFYDLGVRNIIIANTNPLSLRNDIGQLWENFLAVERIKKQRYKGIYANNYFWRTWDKKEVDWIEEREGRLFAYEFKYSPKKSKISFSAFRSVYPHSKTTIVTNENFLEFIG